MTRCVVECVWVVAYCVTMGYGDGMETRSLAQNLSLKEFRSALLQGEMLAHNHYNRARNDGFPESEVDRLWDAYQDAVRLRRDAGVEAGAPLSGEAGE